MWTAFWCSEGTDTLLRAARDLAGRKIPFLGINLGHLGYLAEIEEQNVTSALDRLIEGMLYAWRTA